MGHLEQNMEISLEQYNAIAERLTYLEYKLAEYEWKPFEVRLATDEEKEEFGTYYDCDIEYFIDGFLPDDGDEILVSDGKYVWEDTFVHDHYGVGLESHGEIEDGMAWMSLPEPYKGEQNENSRR